MFAARAGAREVVALDWTSIAHIAERLVVANDLADVVHVVRGSAADYQHSEPVDVLVSEWLGHFAFTEGMFPYVAECRDANLRPGGRMLPSRVELLLAPIESDVLFHEDGPGYWKRSLRDIDLSSLESEEIAQALPIKVLVQPEELLAPAQPLLSLDLVRAQVDDLRCSGRLKFRAARAGVLHGVAGWFRAQLSPRICLDTGPDAPPTHWQQLYFPLTPRPVLEGERLAIHYALCEHPSDAAA